jgi:hypothetical protein
MKVIKLLFFIILLNTFLSGLSSTSIGQVPNTIPSLTVKQCLCQCSCQGTIQSISGGTCTNDDQCSNHGDFICATVCPAGCTALGGGLCGPY